MIFLCFYDNFLFFTNNIIENYRKDDKAMNNFTGGLITGAVLGAIVGMLADPIKDKKHKQMTKAKNEMFKTVGAAIDNIMDMF